MISNMTFHNVSSLKAEAIVQWDSDNLGDDDYLGIYFSRKIRITAEGKEICLTLFSGEKDNLEFKSLEGI